MLSDRFGDIMADLKTNIAGIELRNPVLPAAGPNVKDATAMLSAWEAGAGGIVSKTVSIKPADDKRPTIRKTICSGLTNYETWSETPLEAFLSELHKVKDAGCPLITSIGYQPSEVRELGALIEKEISPEGFEFSVHYVGHSTEPIVEVARALRGTIDKPIFMKVSPNFLNIPELIRAVLPFVDGFAAINSFGPVLDFDPENPIPRLGSDYGQGWISGPPILPIALRIVYQISSVTDKPIIGVGGIEKGSDAVKMLMAGASAVGICSGAIKFGHHIYGKVASETGDWLDKHGYRAPSDIVGSYARELSKRKGFAVTPANTVDTDKCVGCGACLSKCLQDAISMQNDKASVEAKLCIGCGYCTDFCPKGALTLEMR